MNAILTFTTANFVPQVLYLRIQTHSNLETKWKIVRSRKKELSYDLLPRQNYADNECYFRTDRIINIS